MFCWWRVSDDHQHITKGVLWVLRFDHVCGAVFCSEGFCGVVFCDVVVAVSCLAVRLLRSSTGVSFAVRLLFANVSPILSGLVTSCIILSCRFVWRDSTFFFSVQMLMIVCVTMMCRACVLFVFCFVWRSLLVLCLGCVRCWVVLFVVLFLVSFLCADCLCRVSVPCLCVCGLFVV